MKIAIVINASRLTDTLKDTLLHGGLAQKFNISYDLFIPKPNEIENTLKQLNHSAYNACLIGGGDGTVRSAVQVLKDFQLPIIVLPLGTFNVLAKSMDYPNTIEEIFDMIKNNKTKNIDLAEVNGNVFLNHAWLGFYTYILKMREKNKDILGRSKFLKAIFNAFYFFNRLPIYEFQIKTEDTLKVYKTCLIFISNNQSSSKIFNFGERDFLSTGLLYVTILKSHTRWQLFCCILLIIFTDFKNSKKYIINFTIDQLTVSSIQKHINIVLDGESLVLENPLQFTNHKNKLVVITK